MRIPSLATLLASIAVLGLSPAGAATAQSGCDVLGGAVQAGNVCQVKSTTANYHMDIRFPVDYPDEGAIVAYLTPEPRWVRQRRPNTGLPEPSLRNGRHLRVVQVGVASAGTQSVVLKLFQDVGGAHPVTWYKAFTYDLSRRQPVTFDSLFPPASVPLALRSIRSWREN